MQPTGRLRYFFYWLLLFLLWSCRGSTPVADAVIRNWNSEKISQVELLGSDAFYIDTANYHRSFFGLYNAALTEGNFEEAKQLLLKFGKVSYEVFDTTFIATATRFVNNNYPVAVDTSYALICHFLSWNNYWANDYQAMLYWGKKSLASCVLPQAERTKSLAYSDIGTVYTDIGKIDTAIYYFLAANEILVRIKDSALLAQNNIDIGVCYYRLNAVEECKKYICQSSDLYMALRDTSNYLLNQTYFPLYAETLEVDTTTLLRYIDDITKGYEQYSNKSKEDSFYQYLLVAKQKLVKKEYSQAKRWLDTCERISSTLAVNSMEGEWLTLNTEYQLATAGQISREDEAEIIFSAREMVQEGNFSDATEAYNLLSKNAIGKKNFKEALYYKSVEQKLKDSIHKISVKSQLFEVEKKYQSERKEQQITLQRKAILSRNTTIALLATTIGGLVLLGVLLQSRQRQKKLTQEKQNTQKYTRQLLQKTEEERKRIASDLHDSISHELLSLKTAVRMEDTVVINEKVDTIINDIRIISRNLHPVLFEKIGLMHSIEQMAERTQQQNNFMLTADMQYTTGALSSSSELQVYRIVQEGVTNILKYSQAIAGKITIRETPETVQIEIKDNGKGFDVQDKLDGGQAFGLHNIIERSRAIGGEAKIESGAGGTVIKIIIPKT